VDVAPGAETDCAEAAAVKRAADRTVAFIFNITKSSLVKKSELMLVDNAGCEHRAGMIFTA
jgi:hypothetical protein